MKKPSEEGRQSVLFLFSRKVHAPRTNDADQYYCEYPDGHFGPSVILVIHMHQASAMTATTIPQLLPWNNPTARAATLTFSNQSAKRFSIVPSLSRQIYPCPSAASVRFDRFLGSTTTSGWSF
jgi:hypothetical protein